MSTPKHTPAFCDRFEQDRINPYTNEHFTEPDAFMTVVLGEGLAADGVSYALVHGKNQEAVAQRLVDLWNNCEGINPAAVPELLKYAQIRADILKRNFGDRWADSDEGKMVSAALKLAKGE